METYVVHTTKVCDMACRYCYEKDKTSTYTWKEVKKFIDDIVDYRTSDSFRIEFLGGEPMLAKDLIIKSVDYFKTAIAAKGVTVESFVITTNGTVIDDDFIKFLQENIDVRFAISLDGHKFANQFRVMKDTGINSYDLVMKNIKIMQDNNLNPSIHMVTHPYNVAYLYDSIIHLYNKGIVSIDVGTVESTMIIDKKYCDIYVSELKKVSDDIANGKHPGLSVAQFGWVKPKGDKRTYLRDKKSGKLIGESYGRSGDDITHHTNDKYDIQICNTNDPISTMIYEIRDTIYNYHQDNMNNRRTKK